MTEPLLAKDFYVECPRCGWKCYAVSPTTNCDECLNAIMGQMYRYAQRFAALEETVKRVNRERDHMVRDERATFDIMRGELRRAWDLIDSLHAGHMTLEQEIRRLITVINTPHIDNFFEAVRLDAAHQEERFGTNSDAGKSDADWFWLLGYLAQKSLTAPNIEKKSHHIITVAAACLNWYLRSKTEWSRMREYRYESSLDRKQKHVRERQDHKR